MSLLTTLTNKYLDDNWKNILRLSHTAKTALFWGAFNGALLGLAVFSDVLSPKLFLTLNILGYATVAVARVTKQPGADI